MCTGTGTGGCVGHNSGLLWISELLAPCMGHVSLLPGVYVCPKLLGNSLGLGQAN